MKTKYLKLKEMTDVSIYLQPIIQTRIKNKQKIKKAMDSQDKLAKKAGNWNAVEVIREWREKRHTF